MFFTQLSRHLPRAGAALAVAVLALGAAPAAAQMTTLGDGAAVTPIPACAGGGATRVDNFTLQASQAGDTVRLVRVQLGPSGVASALGRVELRDASNATLSAVIPANDIVDLPIATPFAVPTAQTQYSIWVTPKAFGSVPVGVTGAGITAKVILFFNMFGRTGADTTSGVVPLDTTPPAEVGWTSLIGTNSPAARIQLTWKVPSDAQSVIIARDTKPVVAAPTPPNDYSTYAVNSALGSSVIRYSGIGTGGWLLNDTTGLTSGASYYYKAFVRDACGNWSAGEPIGPIVAGVSGEGDATPGSVKPMVGILNPVSGAVVGNNFKVQARVYSPRTAGGVVQPIGTVMLYWTRAPGGAGNTGSATLTRNPAYGTATDLGVFEPSPVLSLTAGSYTFYVNAANSGGANTNSAVIPVTVGAAGGDGNLLRRDNSSQLCNDCHALPTHSTEYTSNKKGIWYTGCRSCHQPHGTTNASLIASEITPPQVGGQLPPTKTFYSGTTGYDPAGGGTNTTTITAATFANGDRTGPCQVCHTRTKFFTRAGAPGDGGPTNLQGGAAHYTTNCGSCHRHTGGFGASCTSCHGTTTPRVVSGADSLVDAAPPRDHLGNTLPTAIGVGSHLAHVTGSRFRAPLACAECHPSPGSGTHPDGSTTVQFQTVDCDWGRGAACTPQTAWTTSTPNCSTLYCHGNFTGGSGAAPQWNIATSGSVQCGNCHGIPPSNNAHLNVTSAGPCTGCHGNVYTPSTIDPALHMNGVLDASGCDGCHGSPTRVSNWATNPQTPTFTDTYVRPMPPKDSKNNTLTSSRKVGAHDTHVNKPQAGALAYPLLCDECHVPPIPPGDPAHINSSTPMLSGLGFNTTAVTCNTYCHGSTMPGGLNQTPVWTTVDGTQKRCVSCHNSPPPTADRGHPNNSNCGNCHPAGYDPVAQTVSASALVYHVDSIVQVNTTGGCARCHGIIMSGAARLDPAVAPGYVGTTTGYDTHGSNLASAIGVGAHDAHIHGPTGTSGAGIVNAISCDNCHGNLPTLGTHANSVVDVGWSALAQSTYTLATTLPTAFNATWEGSANPNCTNYCHSNASPAGGARSTVPSPNWTSTATLACNSCHAFQADKVLNASSTNLSHGHWLHTAPVAQGGYGLNCSACHNGEATGTAGSPATGQILAAGRGNHVNGTHNLSFDTTLNPAGWSYSLSGRTCSNLYCHSNGTSTTAPPANVTPAWTGALTPSRCGGCHGDATNIATGKHAAHVRNDATLGTAGSYHCGDCHQSTVQAFTDATIVSTVLHVNGTRNVSVATRPNGGTSTDPVAGNCSAVYCHSSGQRSGATPAPATWADATWTTVCNKCHGTGNAYGAPSYVSGGPNTATANSHLAHANGPEDCYACHSRTTGSGQAIMAGGYHTNGTIDVWFSTTMAGSGAQAGFTAGNATNSASCRNVSCHGNNLTAVVWGGAAQTCRSCHFGATGAGNSDLDDYVYNNGTMAKIDPEDWGTFGHGAISNWVESANTASNFDGGGTPLNPTRDGCLYCHMTATETNGVAHGSTSNPYRLRNVTFAEGKLGVCLVCHSSSGVNGATSVTVSGAAKTAVTKISSVHYGADHVTGNEGGQYCWDCHDPHGDFNYGAGQRLAYMFQMEPVMNHAATTLATDWGQPRNYPSSKADLAATPDFRKNRSATGISANAWDWTDYVSSLTQPYNGVCQVCHVNTTYYSRTLSDATHNNGAVCTSCHQHQQSPTTAFAGNGDCTQCHAQEKPINALGAGTIRGQMRRAVALEFGYTWSHKRSGQGKVTQWDCIICHMEGDPNTGKTTASHMNGLIDLRDPDTGTTIMTASWSGTGAGSWTSNNSLPANANRFSRNLTSGTIETFAASVMVNQCLKCHDSNGAAAFGTGMPLYPLIAKMGGSATKPFGTTVTYPYNATGQTTTIPSGIYTAGAVPGGVINVDASFATTNASYHPVKGKQNNSYTGNGQMMAPWNTLATNKTAGNITATNAWGFLVSCWDCHAYNGAGGTLTNTVTAHGGAVTLRAPIFQSSMAASGNLCRVCHFPTTVTRGHGAGSAAATVNSRPAPYMSSQCYVCHGSSYSKPQRPIRAEDTHGFDAFVPGTGQGANWPVGTTDTYKPYAFFRSVGTATNAPGRWGSTGSWQPRTGPSVPAGGATCGNAITGCNNNSHGTYGPGGIY